MRSKVLGKTVAIISASVGTFVFLLTVAPPVASAEQEPWYFHHLVYDSSENQWYCISYPDNCACPASLCGPFS